MTTAVEVGSDLPLTLKEQAQWMLHRLTPGSAASATWAWR
jgi:hypothetical protein